MFEKHPRQSGANGNGGGRKEDAEDERHAARSDTAASGPGRAATAIEGIVREALPYAQYRVEVDRGRHVVAHTPAGAGRNFIRVLIGDRVRLELSPKDLTRGRIVAVVK